MIKCPNANCGFENPDGSKFCCACGTKLDIKLCCPSCGADLISGAKFCNNCGYNFVNAEETKLAAVQTEMGKTATIVVEESLSATEKIVLKNAVESMYSEGKTKEAYKQLKALYSAHPDSKEVLSEFLPVCAKANPDELKGIAEKVNDNISAKHIALFLVSIDEGNMVLAEKYLSKAQETMTDDETALIDSCRLRFCEYMSEKYGEEESCKKAGQLRKILESSKDMKVEYLINIMDKAVEEANQMLFADSISVITTVYSELPKHIHEGNTEKAFELYANVGKNNVMAKYMLAVCYYYGWGCPKNLIEAFNCVRFVLKTTTNTILRKNTEKLQTAVITDKDEDGRTVLLSFCRDESFCLADKGTFTLDFIMELIDVGADVNAINSRGETPLYWASASGNAEFVKLLLEHGADVNAKARYQTTPLMNASGCGDAECVKLLLDHGADVNAKSDNNVTPLHCASRCGNAECVKLLLDHGADVNAKDTNRCTPLMEASSSGNAECVKLLLDHGADVNTCIYRLFYTSLHYASRCGHAECVKLLLEHGADVNAKDCDEMTPLMEASECGHAECVKLLLEHGADVNARKQDNNMALSLATWKGHAECVKLLLEHGADVVNKYWYTDYQYSAQEGHRECVRLLDMYISRSERTQKDTIESNQSATKDNKGFWGMLFS